MPMQTMARTFVHPDNSTITFYPDGRVVERTLADWANDSIEEFLAERDMDLDERVTAKGPKMKTRKEMYHGAI